VYEEDSGGDDEDGQGGVNVTRRSRAGACWPGSAWRTRTDETPMNGGSTADRMVSGDGVDPRHPARGIKGDTWNGGLYLLQLAVRLRR